MKNRTALTAVACRGILLPTLVIGLLVGCTPAPAESDDGAAAPVAPSSPTTPTPSAPSEQEQPDPVSCEGLVATATIEGFAASGMMLVEDHESAVRSARSIDARFFDLDGLVCKWALPDDIEWFSAGYSELDADTALEIQQLLEGEGYVRTDEGTTVILSRHAQPDTAGHNPTYLFDGTAWYHSSHANGVYEVRDEVTASR